MTLKTNILRHLIPERIPWFAAGLYDRIARKAIDHYYKQVANEIVNAVDRGIILDVGTGPGYLPIRIAKIAPAVRIDALDLSKRLIEIARINAKEEDLSDRINFRVGDGNRLPFEDDSYNMVISTGALHSWKNPTRVMNECHRVLQPGCEAWIYDPARIITGEVRKLLKEDLGMRDRIVFKWAAWTTKAIDPRTSDEIRGIIAQSRFGEGRVEHDEWLKIVLRKQTGALKLQSGPPPIPDL